MTGIILAMVALCAMEYRISRQNVGTEYNGFGAIPGVVGRTGPAPGRYRVLVPFIVGRLPPRWRLAAYLALKWGLMGAALWAAWPLVGNHGGLPVLAILMAATFEFDYWDGYAELLGVCLCLSGEPWAVLAGSVVWGLSRETVFLAVPLAVVAGRATTGGCPYVAVAALAGVLAWGLVRWRQGRADLYSGRWTGRKARLDGWRGRGRPRGEGGQPRGVARTVLGLVAMAVVNPYNATDLRRAWERRDVGVLLSLAFAVAGVVVAFSGRLPVELQETAWIGLLWIVMGWTLARARETRLFLPVALWIAGSLNH